MSSRFTRRSILGAGAALASVPLIGSSAKAQAWKPTKPVRVICGYPAGGGSDALARAFADYLSKQLGQPFVVENKAGASGSVAALEVKRAAARRLHADVHHLHHHGFEQGAVQEPAV